MGELRIIRSGFGAEAVDYQTAWDDQRARHAARVADLVPDTVILLEHPPVYTAGKRTEPIDRPFDGTPVIDVDRGGKITWHGPGQLVGYPIVRLPEGVYVVDFVRRVEQVIIEACADLGLRTERVKGRSGVWVPGDDLRQERKLAAIGLRFAQGATMHGFAVNCDNDLDWFHRIVPCGIRDAGVTTLSEELGRQVTVQELLPIIERHLYLLTEPKGAATDKVRAVTVADTTIVSATSSSAAAA
ncbi:MAG TPA: lipoyl(octanoyl) transferase LipB [Actinocrinis sp.]|uniref:lipoyl(octanoyl) transferase LipB n=1 Tax=Actinocrinis sp. TaxID=1920516 RepID=UPI002DDD4E9F|nr:lipoyl(octanoyl) transferase LipB [Actinocrinis sp.]HEV2345511.1 lipoyl(octanoyl) transferase LipB [Actinocrinis sp.]